MQRVPEEYWAVWTDNCNHLGTPVSEDVHTTHSMYKEEKFFLQENVADLKGKFLTPY